VSINELEELEGVHQAKDLGIPAFKSNTGNADRKAILDANRRVREGIDPAPRDFGSGGGFGRAMLRIPEFDLPFIQAMFPETKSHDATERTKAWQKFARSPLSEKYRVTPRKGNRSRIIVP